MAKTPEELVQEVKDKFTEIDTGLKSKAEGSALEALKLAHTELKQQLEEIKGKEGVDKTAFDELKAAMIIQGEEITRMKQEGPKNVQHKTIREALNAAFAEKKTEIDEMLAKGQKAPLHVKVAVTMGEDNTIGAGSTQVTLTQNTGIISEIRKREVRYLANVSVGSIGTQRALWIEETDEQGTPIFIGEGDSKTQLSVRYEEKTQSVKKIAVYGKVTTELMADLPQLISYIQNNLMRRMDIEIENQLFSGDNTGDNLKGLEEYATAFSAGSLAASVEDANELDVIEAVALQVETAFGVPNGLFIHPSDMAKIKLIKDANGRPVWKDYVTISGEMNISGMRIITTTAVDAGTFIGGDLTVVNVLIREELGIQIGLDGNDFINNKKTMLLEKRMVQFVSANDTQVLVQGDFTTAKAALEVIPAP